MSRAAGNKSPSNFDQALERVRRGERVVLRRGKKAVAAVVPIEDLKRLQELEDQEDVEESIKRLTDPKEKRIPYEVIRRQSGL